MCQRPLASFCGPDLRRDLGRGRIAEYKEFNESCYEKNDGYLADNESLCEGQSMRQTSISKVSAGGGFVVSYVGSGFVGHISIEAIVML